LTAGRSANVVSLLLSLPLSVFGRWLCSSLAASKNVRHASVVSSGVTKYEHVPWLRVVRKLYVRSNLVMLHAQPPHQPRPAWFQWLPLTGSIVPGQNSVRIEKI